MGTKNNPGQFDCYEKLEPDEPFFVLMARDPQAAALVRIWALDRQAAVTLGEVPEEDQAKVDEANVCCDAMTEWRKEHRP